MADIIRYLEYLAFRYPQMVELITIGHSYEGQPIKMAKVSAGLNKEGERKPAIWIDAGEFHSPSFCSSFYKIIIPFRQQRVQVESRLKSKL